MKKFFFSILAVGAMVACTKSEVNYNDASEISFAPVASTATKAVNGAVDGTTYPTDELFKVWAYWQEKDVNTSEEYFTSDAKLYIAGNPFKKDGDYWRGWDVANNKARPYTWPKTGSLIFACLSPSDAPVANLTHSLVENKFTFNYENPANTANTVDLLWANNTPNSYAEQSTAVPIEFKHALSWITFRVQGVSEAIGKYDIKSITMNDVNTTGAFDSSNTGTWSEQGTPYSIAVWNGTKPLAAAVEVIETNARGTLVIPQVKDKTDATKKYTATIVYDNKTGDTVIEETITVDLSNKWEIGKHYYYTIVFTTTEILIEPSVATWEAGDDSWILK